MKHLSIKQQIIAGLGLAVASALVGAWSYSLIPFLPVYMRYILAVGAICCLNAAAAKLWLIFKRQASQIETMKKQNHDTTFNAHQLLLNRLSDLRRPLQGILGVRDIYDTEAKSPEMRDFLDVVDHCVKFVVNQLDRVQFFSEFEIDRIKLDRQPTNLRQLAEKVARNAEFSIFGGHAKIDLQISNNIPRFVIADSKMLETALVEILTNAVKHINCGPVILNITKSDQNENEVHFKIIDSGPGFAQEEITSALSKGLGLPIVRQVVRKLHGKYSIDSQPGRGTVFTVSLPLPAIEPKAQDLVQAHLHASSSQILVVDDEILTRQLMRKLLERLGYSVTLAENGKEAIRLQHEHKFGVIFMDLEMPEISGLETSQHITKFATEGAKPQIVALTGHGLTENRDQCKAAGMTEFLVKPASIKSVEAVLLNLGIKPLKAIQKVIELERMYALYGEDENVVREVLRHAQHSMPKLQNALNAAIMAGTHKDVKNLLADLKDDLASIHCNEGIEQCDQLSALSEQASSPEFHAAMDALNKSLHKVMGEVSTLVVDKNLTSHL